jgi:hypothetical protein
MASESIALLGPLLICSDALLLSERISADQDGRRPFAKAKTSPQSPFFVPPCARVEQKLCQTFPLFTSNMLNPSL